MFRQKEVNLASRIELRVEEGAGLLLSTLFFVFRPIIWFLERIKVQFAWVWY